MLLGISHLIFTTFYNVDTITVFITEFVSSGVKFCADMLNHYVIPVARGSYFKNLHHSQQMNFDSK